MQMHECPSQKGTEVIKETRVEKEERWGWKQMIQLVGAGVSTVGRAV